MNSTNFPSVQTWVIATARHVYTDAEAKYSKLREYEKIFSAALAIARRLCMKTLFNEECVSLDGVSRADADKLKAAHRSAPIEFQSTRAAGQSSTR